MKQKKRELNGCINPLIDFKCEYASYTKKRNCIFCEKLKKYVCGYLYNKTPDCPYEKTK